MASDDEMSSEVHPNARGFGWPDFVVGLFGEGGLLRVRGIAALTVIGVFAKLAISGDLPIEVIVAIISSVVSVYFGARIAQGS